MKATIHFRTCPLPRRPEILEQALEGRAVLVAVVPAAEVSDETCAPEMGGPSVLGLHHGLVDPDG